MENIVFKYRRIYLLQIDDYLEENSPLENKERVENL